MKTYFSSASPFVCGRNRLFPPPGPAMWRALCDQSLGDGLTDAALLARAKSPRVRQNNRRGPGFDGQLDKVSTCLDAVETTADECRNRLDIGTVSIARGLGYLDFRIPEFGWCKERRHAEAGYASICERPSMMATKP